MFTFQSTIRTPSLVVALDIGSTYSGYAWQWRRDGDPNLSSVEFNTSWGVGALQLLKTSTCLLLKETAGEGDDYVVDSIGYKAEKRYCNYKRTEGNQEKGKQEMQAKHHFFKQFKLHLYRKDLTDIFEIEADDGLHFRLMLVMSKFIGALKEVFLGMMNNKGQEVDLKRTLWVITVPAIWTEKARGFMKEAALKAGINKHNILLALEPEVASIYCLHQTPLGTTLGDKRKYITVDLGGGTVDITAFEVLNDGLIKPKVLSEMCEGHGKLVGGQDINNAFFHEWRDAFHLQDWNEISKKHSAEDLLEMEQDFERNKVEIGSSEDIDEHINLAIPDTTRELLWKDQIKLKDSEEVRNFFKIDKGKFMFSPSVVREKLFKVTIDRIVETIEAVLDKDELGDVDTMVLVGGFSESKIVTDEIKRILREKFPRVNVLTPTSPFRAVLTGAVLFGHNPRIFRSRISRKTYGVRTSSFFDPEIHESSKKYVDPVDGESYIRGVFSVHVQKGSSVSLNDEHSCVIYYPKREDAKKVRIRIYSSDETDPQFVADAGCVEEGEIIIDLPETSRTTEKQIVVRMIYGGTQLNVVAEDNSTKSPRQFEATIKFK